MRVFEHESRNLDSERLVCLAGNQHAEHACCNVTPSHHAPRVPFHVADVLTQRRGQVWAYSSEPHKGSCRGLRRGRCPAPRGRVLGGSTGVGYMLRTRPPFADFRRWVAAGNEGWGQTLRYFKKAEDQLSADRWPGFTQATGGPVPVSDPPYSSGLSRAFLEAAAWLGYRVHHGENGTVSGFSRLQTTMRDGSRFSAAEAYLPEAVRGRPNLRVETGSVVTRVLWRGNARAAGVEVRTADKALLQYRVRKEVILAAGAVNSPQILMLSGIGPEQHLQSLGIPVLRNLSVGLNLQDHVGVGGLVWTLEDADETLSLVDAKVRTAANTWRWLRHGAGPLTALLGGEAAGFFSSGHNPEGDAEDGPDVALLFTPTSPASVPGLAAVHGLGAVLYDTVFAPLEGNQTFTITPMVLRPASRGRVLLRSKDPMAAPLLQPGFLTHARDVAVALEGVGTCKMGVDADSVVDARLRVRGTSGLRVADASVVPAAPASLLEAVVTMVAEMAADLIKQDWGAYRTPPPPGFPPPPAPDPFLGTTPAPAPSTTSSSVPVAPVQTPSAPRGQQGRPGGSTSSPNNTTVKDASSGRPAVGAVDYREPRE
ncbi:uncharacterized GMC-type oxidoreductase Mb1310-like [Thrips palmi]|uniref:Uncharacterized GMC-type oxidoreductase Mb1310-like n=1 Tax=Thrips palmi TaxID=161013 RepID=A0A6P8YK82_THRPL|nr:uncharacterized GMC-type oxidoreductase Mb1310-like [Thrips palmi]